MIQRNTIDTATTNGCPDITPAQLLAESATEEDCRKLEQVMGRFTSTTGFLIALKAVLVDLEGFPEAVALEKFLPIMAHVEAKAMNGDSEPAVKSIQDYPRVENGELLNAGETSAHLLIDKLASALTVW